mmetsp:Transcript_33784/g.85550  ORF Transcript_33784/g.85550 Transcript_33784/m.85550 type:complete len:299 (-) Transcript_33784:593-1489(-)
MPTRPHQHEQLRGRHFAAHLPRHRSMCCCQLPPKPRHILGRVPVIHNGVQQAHPDQGSREQRGRLGSAAGLGWGWGSAPRGVPQRRHPALDEHAGGGQVVGGRPRAHGGQHRGVCHWVAQLMEAVGVICHGGRHVQGGHRQHGRAEQRVARVEGSTRHPPTCTGGSEAQPARVRDACVNQVAGACQGVLYASRLVRPAARLMPRRPQQAATANMRHRAHHSLCQQRRPGCCVAQPILPPVCTVHRQHAGGACRQAAALLQRHLPAVESQGEGYWSAIVRCRPHPDVCDACLVHSGAAG